MNRSRKNIDENISRPSGEETADLYNKRPQSFWAAMLVCAVAQNGLVPRALLPQDVFRSFRPFRVFGERQKESKGQENICKNVCCRQKAVQQSPWYSSYFSHVRPAWLAEDSPTLSEDMDHRLTTFNCSSCSRLLSGEFFRVCLQNGVKNKACFRE